MAGETECADVVVGDGEVFDGESAADGEGHAADAMEGVESDNEAGVVTGPDGVRDGVECECGNGLSAGWDRYRWSIHDGSSATRDYILHAE